MSLTFTVIQHDFRKSHGLSCNQYILCDMIYHLSTNPESLVQGWCFMSKKHMAEEIGVSERSIYNMLNTLEEQGLIIKQPVTNHLKTSKKWFRVYDRNRKTEEDSHCSHTAKVADGTLQKVQSDTAKIAYNNNSNNNSNILLKETRKKSESGSKQLMRNSPANDFDFVLKKFEGADEFEGVDLFYYFHQVKDWSDSSDTKRTVNGWIATIRTFIRKDAERNKVKKSVVDLDQQKKISDLKEYLS